MITGNLQKRQCECVAVPTTPHLLRGWSTVGITSASLVWKYSKLRKLSKFLLYYKSLDISKTKQPEPSNPEERDVLSHGYTCVKLRKFTGGRTSAVLRDLRPGTAYHVLLYAANEAGKSKPLSFFFTTACDPLVSDNFSSLGSISFHKPLMNKLYDCRNCTKAFFKTVCYVLLSLYIFISLAVIIFHFDQII